MKLIIPDATPNQSVPCVSIMQG